MVFAHGASVFWRSAGLQLARLRWVLYQVPVAPYPGCPTDFCDFAVFWAAGRLGAHPALVYNAPDFFAASARILPQGADAGAFMYPPTILPLVYLIARPPLAAAYYVFVAASIFAAAVLFRRARISWPCIIAGLLSPAALWCMYLGQFGILCAAILTAGLAAMENQLFRAGALLATLCIKPQYAMIGPIVILARGSPRPLLGAALAGVVLVAVCGLWFGWDAWMAFLDGGRESIRGLLQGPFASSSGRAGTSAFWMARSVGTGIPAAYALQAASAALAAFCAWQLWRRENVPRNTRIAISLCLALLPSPYGYTDDMVGYSIACVLLMRRDAPATNLLLALLWVAPGYVGQFQAKFGLVPTPFCIIAVALIGWWQLRRDFAPASPAPAARQAAPVLSLPQNLFHRFR